MQIIYTAIPGQTTNLTGEQITGDHLQKIDIAISGMPALTGSPKQIAWAEAIRIAAITDTCKAAMEKVQMADGNWLKNACWMTPEVLAAVDKLNQHVERVAAALAPHTSAKAWIEAHDGSKSQLTVRALLARKAA